MAVTVVPVKMRTPSPPYPYLQTRDAWREAPGCAVRGLLLAAYHMLQFQSQAFKTLDF